MTLERLVEEVRRRSEEDLRKERERVESQAQAIQAARAEALQTVAEASQRALALEISRVRSATLAKAKVEGRRQLFEARQRAAERALAQARDRLKEFTGTPEYGPALKRLFRSATDRLGKQIRVSGRSEDAALLKSIAGRAFSADPVPIDGGLIAETVDGSRRLDYSFGELLRRREAAVLELAGAVGTGG
jgi:vacuolar-type H+-ATPase subunit E/Vma4